jgi:hypothetical protein
MNPKADTVTWYSVNHGTFHTTLAQINAETRNKSQLVKDCKDLFGDCFTSKELQALPTFVLKIIMNQN